MTSNVRKIWVALPVVARATIYAAWSASKIGAIFLTGFFTLLNLAVGIYGLTTGHVKFMELPGVVLGGAFVFALSLLCSFLITIPVSSIVAICSYPFLRALRAVDQRVFGIIGFVVGTLVWLGLFWNGPKGNVYFGLWISWFLVGGPAGYAGGTAFARQWLQDRPFPKISDGGIGAIGDKA